MKKFKSARKLDNLSPGSRVTFAEEVTVYAQEWTKLDSGKWVKRGDTFSTIHPFTAESMRAINNNRPFLVTREGE